MRPYPLSMVATPAIGLAHPTVVPTNFVSDAANEADLPDDAVLPPTGPARGS